jgi:Sulfotransferase family
MLDYLCIGAQKAGTTWLANRLARNPGCWMHPFKELHYFDHLYCPASRNWTLKHLQRAALRLTEMEMMRGDVLERFDRIAFLMRCADRSWTFTEDWYTFAFSIAPAHCRKGECTPAYAGIGREGIAHVKRLMPDVRIIYLIRDPMERAWSQIRMNIARRHAAAASQPPVNLLLQEARHHDIAQRGDYASFIPEWDRAFGGHGQMLYLPYRQIAVDPDAVLDRVERHIGAEQGDRQGAGNRVNAAPPLELPHCVRDFLEEILAPQYAYLQQRFGADFVAEA